MAHTLLFLPLSTLVLTGGSSSLNTIHVTLLTIKTKLGNHGQLASWNSTNYCSWSRVTCMGGGVTRLSFKNLSLTGTVPASVCSLKRLMHLDLSLNNLTGTFPSAALYGCTEL
jgi:hypothetical protein